ncbi:MAG: electron transport complex subunit RsxC [Staphylococcus sp.]|nr:electron transport complex subunit RsxC [Staphylococcus sp.]
MKLHTFKIGGIHPAENKIAAGKPIENMPLPEEVVLPVAQHIGAPANPIVKKGDKVRRGDCVAEAGGFVSAPIHTPISGTVTKIDVCRTPQGLPVQAIYIKSDEADRQADADSMMNREKPVRSESEIAVLDGKAIIDIIKSAGIVGLGGATFPCHVKLSPPPGSKAEVVIINAAECEPCLSCDDMLMRENPAQIVKGVELLMKAAGVNRGVIAIENNKPEAIAALTAAATGSAGIEVMPMMVKYPQGGEKQLIEAVIGKEVPSGGLPIATGAIVQNVATAYAVYRAVVLGEPLMDRVLTLHDGETGRNMRVPFGTILATLVGDRQPEKIIIGGPMMGRTASTLQTPMIKGTSGILLDSRYAHRREAENCIRCGKCSEACPMGLEPFLLATLSRLKEWDEAESQKIANCIECGSCSYACPASRPVVDYVRLGKQKVMAAMRARAAAAKK